MSNAMSRLVPILEPEVRAWEYEGRISGTEYENRMKKEEKRLPDGCHRSWSGSRRENVVYDWTRPTDGEVQRRVGDSVGREGHGQSGFRDVVWDKEGRKKSFEDAQFVRWDESVQRMDWALMM
jgi:hypothetical protein